MVSFHHSALFLPLECASFGVLQFLCPNYELLPCGLFIYSSGAYDFLLSYLLISSLVVFEASKQRRYPVSLCLQWKY